MFFRSPRCCLLLLAWLIAAGSASAQTFSGLTKPASTVGIMVDPCDALTSLPPEITDYLSAAAKAKAEGRTLPSPSPEKLAHGMVLYSAWEKTRLTEDFAGHCRYEKDNAALVPAKARVVLFGDSITEFWGKEMPELFGAQFVDRGISGQTSAQMIIRFRQDVIDLSPLMVQIMAGTNDIAGNTGPGRLTWIEQNIAGMVELAKSHNIGVLLASAPPAKAFSWRAGIEPQVSIAELNAWLQRYAAEQCLSYVDYYAVLVDAQGGMKQAYTADGVHPNRAGYEVMRPLLEHALAAPHELCH